MMNLKKNFREGNEKGREMRKSNIPEQKEFSMKSRGFERLLADNFGSCQLIAIVT